MDIRSPNPVRQKLAAGQCVTGAAVFSWSPYIIDAAGYAGRPISPPSFSGAKMPVATRPLFSPSENLFNFAGTGKISRQIVFAEI